MMRTANSVSRSAAVDVEGWEAARSDSTGIRFKLSTSALWSVLDAFIAWLDRYGEISFDHQSYYAGPLGARAKALYYRRKWLGKAAVLPMVASEALIPSARVLFWKRQRFPIADAHYARGFANLAAVSGLETHYLRARHFLEILKKTRSTRCRELGWGYPFDWETRNGVISAGTPLITTTPYVYEACSALYELDGDSRWRAMMASIARHAMEEIPCKQLDDRTASAGYHPWDQEAGVINASAYRGFLLRRAGEDFGENAFCVEADRNLRFVVSRQREDGSWPYADDGVRPFVDHFHTCFVLKALAKTEYAGSSVPISATIDRGVDFYTRHLFDEEGLPRPFAVAPRLTVYRRELYDYAEAINIAVLLGARNKKLDGVGTRTLNDLLRRWRRSDGAFRSRELLIGWDNVPMHRWAQSQVFHSLTQVLRARQGDDITASMDDCPQSGERGRRSKTNRDTTAHPSRGDI